MMTIRSSARAVTEAASDQTVGEEDGRARRLRVFRLPPSLQRQRIGPAGDRARRCHSSLSAGCRRPDLPATGRARRPILTPVCRPVRKIVLIDGWRRIGVVVHSRDNLQPLVSLSQAVGLYLPSLSMV